MHLHRSFSINFNLPHFHRSTLIHFALLHFKRSTSIHFILSHLNRSTSVHFTLSHLNRSTLVHFTLLHLIISTSIHFTLLNLKSTSIHLTLLNLNRSTAIHFIIMSILLCKNLRTLSIVLTIGDRAINPLCVLNKQFFKTAFPFLPIPIGINFMKNSYIKVKAIANFHHMNTFVLLIIAREENCVLRYENQQNTSLCIIDLPFLWICKEVWNV